MALKRQPVHINFTGGVDTSVDERLVIPSKLAVAQHVEFEDKNTLIRRGGMTRHAATGAGRMFSSGGATLVEADSALLRIISGAANQQVLADSSFGGTQDSGFVRAGLSSSEVGHPAFLATSGCAFDSVSMNGYTVFVSNNGSDIHVSCVKDSDQQILASYVIPRSSGDSYSRPKVAIHLGTGVFSVFWMRLSGGAYTIRHRTFNSTTLAMGSETAVGGTPNASLLYDVAYGTSAAGNGEMIFLLMHITGGDLAFYWYSDNCTTLAASGTTTPAVTSLSKLNAVITDTGGSNHFTAVYTRSGANQNAIFAAAMDDSGATAGESNIANEGGGAYIGRITAIDTTHGTSATGLTIFYEYRAGVYASPPAQHDNSIRQVTTSKVTLAAATAYNVVSGVFIYAKVAKVGARYFLPTILLSPDDPTVFVTDVTYHVANNLTANYPPQVVARLSYGDCGGFVWAHAQPLSGCPASSTTLQVPFTRWSADLGSGGFGGATPPADINFAFLRNARLDFAENLGFVETRGGALLAGGCPQFFDGRNVVEAGFNFRPTIVSLTKTAAGGSLSAGVYGVCATYLWTDAAGNRHESAPSEVSFITAVANDYLTIEVSTNQLTRKAGVQVVIYRTEANLTVLHRAAQVDNSFAALTVSDTSYMADTDLAGCEPVPTTGEVLPNVPVYPHRCATEFQNRLFLTGCEDSDLMRFSQAEDADFFVVCAEVFLRETDASFGRIVGAVELDQKLSVFGENAVGFLVGEGPTNTGAQDNYSSILVAAPNSGALWGSGRALFRIPEGVLFFSDKGIRLLGRDGSIAQNQDGSEVGSEMDGYATAPASFAWAVAAGMRGIPQVYFLEVPTSGYGRVLVYNWSVRQWTTWPSTKYSGAKDLLAVGGVLKHSTTSGVYSISSSENTDDGTTFNCYIETSWLQFAGIQGFQRLHSFRVLGYAASGVQQNITAYTKRDFNDVTAVETVPVTYTPATGNVVQFEHHLATQKCEALKIALSWAPASVARMRITDLSLMVGVKGGSYKVPSSKRY